MQWSFSIDSKLVEVAALRAELQRLLTAQSIAQVVVDDAQLIIDEVLTNTIDHGYAGESGHRIDLHVAIDAASLKMTFEDDAPAFDPLQELAPDSVPDGDDQMPMGGVGLVLVRRVADCVDYRHRDGRNCLTTTQTVAGEVMDRTD